MHQTLRSTLLATLLTTVASAEVIINEIMYHPSSELSTQEYIELYNNGAVAVDVSGWQFTNGVAFTFPAATSIGAGQYLVVAANGAAFTAKYPTVTNFVAGWTGQLSNSGNKITLKDVLSVPRDEVSYTDDGDWGQRQRQDPPDYGHRGWVWGADADGFGKSIEVINALYDNSTGQNWTASSTLEGTPGAVNSVAAADLAPIISDAAHSPLVPTSSQPVSVTCKVVDNNAGPLAVTLYYRNDGAPGFTPETMFDDGAHDDGILGDGIYGASIAPRANGTIVEFYFTATDGASLMRTWPASAKDYTGSLVQRCNLLYQVDNTVYAGASPIYRIVMLAADLTELSNINGNAGTVPFPPTSDQTLSHARFNSTWISRDGTGDKLRYLAGARNRGNGSRTASPPNFNVQFPNDDTWNGLVSVNLNTQDTPYQLFGSTLYRQTGLAGPESRAVEVRVNAVDLANNTGEPDYGFYVCNEVQNSDFAAHHFPLDSSGNIYRAQRFKNTPTAGGTPIPNGGDLTYHTPAVAETLTQVELYKLNYRKETNIVEDVWTDFIATTFALSKGVNGATINDPVTYNPSADAYFTDVSTKVDVAQFVRWLAVQAFADNEETNLSNGDGDDYYIYIGKTDQRAKLVPFDLDTILGRDATANVATHGIFRMVDAPDGLPTPMNAFIKHPKIAPLYYGELIRLLDGAFLPAQLNPLCDSILGGVVPAGVITSMKAFNATRHAHITTLVPRAISVTNSQTVAGAALTVVSGFPQSAAATCKLIGKAHSANTRSVKINGITATWSAWQAQWTAASVALTPGVNRILIQAFDGVGTELEHATHDVWYGPTTEASFSGALASSQTWTAAGGPYRITAAFTVPTGLTLTIEPGAVVYLNAGTAIDFTVASGGQLIAIGTETQPIRFMAAPGGANWGGIIINGGVGTPLSTISHAYIEGNDDDGVDVNAADVVLDHITFGNTAQQYLSLDGASFVVSNCIFPSGTAVFEPIHGTGGVKAGGRGIMRDCFIGRPMGYSDSFDFTGGNRPSPILQFINNVCIGSDDDILDFDGTDAWVEGNVFMHVHRIGTPDSASAVSGGSNGADLSHITIVGNLFYDVDQAATAKQGNFYTFINNTVVDQNSRGSDEMNPAIENPVIQPAVLNFDDKDIAGQALGMYVEGNVIHSAEALVRFYDGALSTVTFNNNLLNMAWTGPGSGNTVADALINDPQITTPNENNFRTLLPAIRAQFALNANSPAKGSGPNGTDKGGIRPFGVSIGGAPSGTTNLTGATLNVGTHMTGNAIPTAADAFPNGSGWTHYKSRLDNGAWSAETPTSTPITISGLADGVHTVEVVGKNDAAFYQDHADFGTGARISSVIWTVDSNYIPPAPAPIVRINEVLASNTETVNFGTVFPDIIELHNAGNASANLSSWGLTDNAALPYKYAIPPGTTLAPGAYLIIYASGNASVPAPKTGFGLGKSGDDLTLTRSAAQGGGIVDSVTWGQQLNDLSIGRALDGTWQLCKPTFSAPSTNTLATLGTLGDIRINEWLTNAVTVFANDFIELYNPSQLPVALGGSHLTDNPAGWPNRHVIAPLTFVEAGSFLTFKADSDTSQGPDHLDFQLSALQGEIGLFSPSLAYIDSIVYGPQTSDISQGRSADGASLIATFTQPTPGAPNPYDTTTVTQDTITTTVIPAPQVWKYFQSPTAGPANDGAGRAFTHSLYDDAAWPSSSASYFWIETSAYPTNTDGFVKSAPTVLVGFNATHPYQTYYFRTHFTYNGALAGGNVTVALNARVICDDSAVFYLNGQEITPRLRMGAGTPTYNTQGSSAAPEVTLENITLTADSLVNGDNVLAVSVHQNSTAAQVATTGSSDITWGMKLDVAATATTVTPGLPIVLNEVLPVNVSLQNPDGSYAGWIELLNTSNADYNIADFSLSDAIGTPRKFIFGASTVVPANGRLVVYCNSLAAVSATNTAFSLNSSGDQIYLFKSIALGGGLQDSIVFGQQLPDLSLARLPDGNGPFGLGVPTRAVLNSAAAIGAATSASVKLNEWLTNPFVPNPSWFEIYNTTGTPIPLSGNYLTDALTNKTKFLIPPLTFIGGNGSSRWLQLIADNDNAATPGHVNFSLSPGEGLGLFTSAGVALDSVTTTAQATGVSQGRYTDGSATLPVSMPPTPGAVNGSPATDADGDGIPDLWELANGMNPNSAADAVLDNDGDEQTNLQEYIAGTNPQQAGSLLAASVAATVTPGEFAITFTALAGKSYTVRYKNNLTDPTWTVLQQIASPGADTVLTVNDTPPANTPKRFYQVVTPQQP